MCVPTPLNSHSSYLVSICPVYGRRTLPSPCVHQSKSYSRLSLQISFSRIQLFYSFLNVHIFVHTCVCLVVKFLSAVRLPVFDTKPADLPTPPNSCLNIRYPRPTVHVCASTWSKICVCLVCRDILWSGYFTASCVLFELLHTDVSLRNIFI